MKSSEVSIQLDVVTSYHTCCPPPSPPPPSPPPPPPPPPQMHSEVVSEMLKEWQEERRRQRLRPLRSRDLDDDESQLSRLWVRAKGFATKKKVTFAARYSRRSEDNEELLEMTSSDSHSTGSNSSSRHVNGSYSREPPKGLFDDI